MAINFRTDSATPRSYVADVHTVYYPQSICTYFAARKFHNWSMPNSLFRKLRELVVKEPCHAQLCERFFRPVVTANRSRYFRRFLGTANGFCTAIFHMSFENTVARIRRFRLVQHATKAPIIYDSLDYTWALSLCTSRLNGGMDSAVCDMLTFCPK